MALTLLMPSERLVREGLAPPGEGPRAVREAAEMMLARERAARAVETL